MDVDGPSASAPVRRRKAAIPASLRAAVWNTYVGEAVGRTPCPVCRVAPISQLTFQCGHVVAESVGGPTTLANLRPVCGKCNQSMQKQNMAAFAARYFVPR